MNKKCVALNEETYKKIISTIQIGFIYEGKEIRPNNRIATALVLEANLGIRISDVLQLRMEHFIRDGSRYRLAITEKKTKKTRNFTVPAEIYSYVQEYAYTMGIRKSSKIFDICERTVQKHLKTACKYLEMDGLNISTHSFRKYFATEIFRNNNYNIELVRILLQHSSITTTQRYIGISSREIETALSKHVNLI